MQKIDEIREEIAKIEEDITKFKELTESLPTLDEKIIISINEDYLSLTRSLEILLNHEGLSEEEANEVDQTCLELLYNIESLYDINSIRIQNYVIETTEKNLKSCDEFNKRAESIESTYKQNQGVQLATFSIVLSILAFVLTNAKVLAIDQISFKSVLLVNLSFILATDCFFSLIYLFIGPVFYDKKGKLRFFAFIIVPFLLIIAIVLIAIYMDKLPVSTVGNKL